MSSKVIVDLELSGRLAGWTDVTEDVSLSAGIEVGPGLGSDTALSRVAPPQVAQLSFLNSASNSAGLAGYYTPGHTNQRDGFEKGAGLRVAVVSGDGWSTDEYQEGWAEAAHHSPRFTGHIATIDPEPGETVGILSNVAATDYMARLARHQLDGPGIGEGVSEATAAADLVGELDIQPRAFENSSSGTDTYDYAHDKILDEQTSALQEAEMQARSSFSTWFVKGDGALVRESRNDARAVFGNPLTPDIALTGNDDFHLSDPPEYPDNTDSVVNRVTATMEPRSVDRDTISVLYAATTVIAVDPDVVVEIRGAFEDGDSRRTGGVDIVTPDTTDYAWNTEPDGSGTDHTANVTVTAVATPSSVIFTVDTTDVAVTSRVYNVINGTSTPLLRIRGYLVEAGEQISAEDSDATSIAAVGRNDLTFDMPYQSDWNVLNAMAPWLLETLLAEERKLGTVWLRVTGRTDASADSILDIETSDIFSATEPRMNLESTGRFHVNGRLFDARPDGSLWIGWTPVIANDGPFIEEGSSSEVKHLTTGGSAKAGSVYKTDSKATTPDALQLLAVNYGRDDSTNPADFTSITGGGYTFTQIAVVTISGAAVNREKLALFRAMESAPTTGKLTLTHPETLARCSWTWIERYNVNTGGTNGSAAVVQTATQNGGGASTTATLAAFAGAENRPVVFGGTIAGHDMTVESGWTRGGLRSSTPPIISGWNDDTADLTAKINYPGEPNTSGVIAAEIDVVT
jgi:hypothetical protein